MDPEDDDLSLGKLACCLTLQSSDQTHAFRTLVRLCGSQADQHALQVWSTACM